VECTFDALGLDYRKYVTVDPRFLRPAEVDQLVGDATKARQKLGWQPTVSFGELVHRMVDADLREIKTELGI